jgi:small-conductance mechanosensitive channel
MSETDNEKKSLDANELASERKKLDAEKAALGKRTNAIEKREKNFEKRISRQLELQKLYEKGRYYIHRLILTSLYILLVFTTVYAVVNIGLTISKETIYAVRVFFSNSSEGPKNIENPQSLPVQSTNEEGENEISPKSAYAGKSNKTETLTLETAEHIFLYLLPLFILLGFFHYYTKNAQFSLIQGSTETVDYEASTISVNLTKILFISSIISYVIIKVIEEILIKGVTNPTKLISFGLLLLLLMSYYLFLDKKHQT